MTGRMDRKNVPVDSHQRVYLSLSLSPSISLSLSLAHTHTHTHSLTLSISLSLSLSLSLSPSLSRGSAPTRNSESAADSEPARKQDRTQLSDVGLCLGGLGGG